MTCLGLWWHHTHVLSGKANHTRGTGGKTEQGLKASSFCVRIMNEWTQTQVTIFSSRQNWLIFIPIWLAGPRHSLVVILTQPQQPGRQIQAWGFTLYYFILQIRNLNTFWELTKMCQKNQVLESLDQMLGPILILTWVRHLLISFRSFFN